MFAKQTKFVYLILFLQFSSILCEDYCHNNGCKDPSKHVFCLYPLNRSTFVPENKVTTCDGDVIFRGIGKHDAARIIEVHNNLIKKLDGPSSTPLTWDPELARLAQAWANQCPNKHDECHTLIKHTYKDVRQNILEIKFTKVNWTDTVSNWFTKDLYESQASGEYHGNNFAMSRIGCGLVLIQLPLSRYMVFKISPLGIYDPIRTLYFVCNYSTSDL